MRKIMICMAVLVTACITNVNAREKAPVAKQVNTSLIQKLPKTGHIVQSNPFSDDFTQYILSNGVTVLFQQTQSDEVSMYALSCGGTSLYPNVPNVNLKAINECLSCSGLGNFSVTELQQKLAGHNISVTPHIGKYEEYISSKSTSKDLETMFQLNHLYFTSLRSDLNAFNTWREQAKAKNSTRATALSNTELDEINYDLVMQLVAQRFSNADDFTFVITGNVAESEIKPLIEKYIASLRTNGKHEQPNFDMDNYSLSNR